MSLLKNVIYLVICLNFLLVSCRNNSPEAPAELHHHEEEDNVVELSDAQIKTAAIALGKIEDKQISGTIKVNGKLDVPPQQLVSISAPLGGFLKNTVLLQGSKVKKGQSIATIENLDFIQIQQDYLEARSNLELAKADYERQQELAKENVNSQKVLQQAKANFTNWTARYNGLSEKLKVLNLNLESVEQGNLRSSINLFSPINGYVTQVNVNIGKFVNPTDVLFEIVDTEHLHAELIIFENDVPKIKLGQKVRFTLANETKERMATVYLIGREISEDRTIQIHCHIDQEDTEFLPGMYLTALVEAGATLVPAVPNEAVIDFEGRKYLFLVTDEPHEASETPSRETTEGKLEAHTEEHIADEHDGGTHFEMVEIQIGSSELGYTEVILPPDFNRDADVVIRGAYALLSKLKNSEDEGGHAH